MKAYNPRFLAYCQAHGLTPEEMVAHDTARWPGGCGTGFITWIQDRWGEWCRLNPERHRYKHINQDHTDFNTWLNETIPLT